MVMSKMKVDEFEEGEIVSEEDGEFLPPQLLLETRKEGHDPCHAIKNSYILDSMVMKMKVDDFEQGEIITQDFLEDGEFIPPHLLPEKRGKEKIPAMVMLLKEGKGRDLAACWHLRFMRFTPQKLIPWEQQPILLAPKRIIPTVLMLLGEEKGRDLPDAHLGESSKTNSLGGAAADTGDSAKRQKICDLGGSDQVTQLSKLLRRHPQKPVRS